MMTKYYKLWFELENLQYLLHHDLLRELIMDTLYSLLIHFIIFLKLYRVISINRMWDDFPTPTIINRMWDDFPTIINRMWDDFPTINNRVWGDFPTLIINYLSYF